MKAPHDNAFEVKIFIILHHVYIMPVQILFFS